MGIINLGQTDNVIEENQSGDIVANLDVVNAGSVSATSIDTELLANRSHYAAGYSGADPDTRIDNAISAASGGDEIIGEAATYDSNHTINKKITVKFPDGSGATITGTWTVTGQGAILSGGDISNGSVDLSANQSVVMNAEGDIGSEVTVNADYCRVTDSYGLGVTFASGTSGGLADSLARSSVTDNGANTVGDVS